MNDDVRAYTEMPESAGVLPELPGGDGHRYQRDKDGNWWRKKGRVWLARLGADDPRAIALTEIVGHIESAKDSPSQPDTKR